MEKTEKDTSIKENSSSSYIEKLAFDTTQELINDADKIDHIRSLTEEEIEDNIIEDEINLRAKLIERLLVSSHLVMLPDFFYEYYSDFDKIPQIFQEEIKEIFRTIFTCFSQSSMQATKVTIPFLNLIDSETLTREHINNTKIEISKKLINWLVSEFYKENRNELLKATEQILSDLQKGFNLPIKTVSYDDKYTYLNKLKKSFWLPLEAKVGLIEKLKKMGKKQIVLLNRVLSQEDNYSRKKNNEIKNNFLIFTKAFKLATV